MVRLIKFLTLLTLMIRLKCMLVALKLCNVVGVAALAVLVSMLTYLKLALEVLKFKDLPIMCGNPHGSVASSSMCGASGL